MTGNPPGATHLAPPVNTDDHARGPSSARVTVVEFGDYQCPHCGDAFRILQTVQEAMGDALRLVFRNFPLVDIHPYAKHAALAAEAAARQGRFWKMHDTLFRHQDRLDDEDLLTLAAGLQLDVDRLASDMVGPAVIARVRSDMDSGLASGVQGTPTFFINGEMYTGSWRTEPLLEAVRQAARPPL